MRTVVRTFLAATLLVAGCSSAPSDEEEPAGPLGIEWHECADAVGIGLPTKHRCGTLTVPRDHADRTGPALGLGVLQVWPADHPDSDQTALTVGFDPGEPRQAPGDVHLLAERIGVAVAVLTPRGVGEDGGTPLGCPELEGVGADTMGRPDSETATRFGSAVAACHDRLVGDGVDLDLFGTDDLAADVEDLRAALEVDQWHLLMSYGGMSRISDAYVAAHPDRVRAVVQDSPAGPTVSTVKAAADGFRSALQALFEECADDPTCARRYPGLAADWDLALERTAARPLAGRVAAGDVLVDASRLVRGVRAMLGEGPGAIGDLPRVISLAAEGRLHPALASQSAGDPDLCLGVRPTCVGPTSSIGAFLSQVCAEDGSQVDETDPMHRDVFTDALAGACETWDVEETPLPPAPAVPTLVITGHLDAWSRPEWFDDPLVVRGARHDVASSATCVLDVRNPWIADPSTEPDHGPCDTEPFPQWD
jgi:pimeloyl-ACP methyl ester carboxylesterase